MEAVFSQASTQWGFEQGQQQEEPFLSFVKDYQLIRVTFLSDSQKFERL